MTSIHVGEGEKYDLRDEHDLHTKLASIWKKLEAIELNKVNEVQVVSTVK